MTRSNGEPPVGRNVLFLTHTAQVSGAELVMLELIRHAIHAGWSVTLACPDGPLRQRIPAEVEILPIPPLGLQGDHGLARLRGIARIVRHWRMAGRAISTARTADADTVVVVNSLFALPAAAAAKVPGGAVWLVHDTISSAKQRAVVRLARRGIRRAVAVSGPTAQPPRSLGLDVTVAHLGVHLQEMTPRVTVTPGVVGIMGSLTPWKGHRVLLEALALLPGVQLEIAGAPFPGDEAYAEDLRSRAQQPDLVGRVRFLGHVDALPTLQSWDAAVSASTAPEAGPLVALEAMSIGLPVVGTDHGGTAVLLADGAGVLVPPADSAALAEALRRILTDTGLRQSIKDTAHRRVRDHYDLDINLPQMFEELVRE